MSIDPKFVCDRATFEELVPQIQSQIDQCAAFDTTAFLRGVKGVSPDVLNSNEQILKEAIAFMGQQAKALADKKNISLEDAYKLLIGALDSYDDIAEAIHKQQKLFNLKSTFVLRSATLLASQREGIGLQSWMVYTKSGKPDFKDIWRFFDNWQNWVPEAQGAMAKFSETTFIQARQLTTTHLEKRLILLKGGFGAGKTRLARQLMKEQASGVVAPDLGKRVVRRSMPSVPHSSAHMQGSQIAYKLFDEMIQKQGGTVVYDSSLSRAEDVSTYLEKSREAGKKTVIYDVARHDMARALSVLQRNVKGDDPRIPPDFIIRSAIQDKLNRIECMKVILHSETEDKENHDAKSATLTPEYHFIGGDAQGWNTEEVMLLTPNKITMLHPEMKERLALEGIEIDEQHNTVKFTRTEEELKTYFNTQFERIVKDIMQDLSKEEQKLLGDTFSQRKLNLRVSEDPIHDAASFYEALPEQIKTVLSTKAVEQAFQSVKQETRDKFFHSIQFKDSISYLDLPLRTALILHQNLQEDPWL